MLNANEDQDYGRAFITLLPCKSGGIRVGVKDLIKLLA